MDLKRASGSLLVLSFLLAALSGCERKGGVVQRLVPPAATEVQLTGVYMDVTNNGLLEVTINGAALAPALHASEGSLAASTSSAAVTALGVMSHQDGGVVNLTGIYDPATDSLFLRGQGYDLAGLFIPSTSWMRGRYSGPNGTGAFMALPGPRGVIHPFCGSYENDAATMFGRLELACEGDGQLVGLQAADGDSTIELLGGSAAGSGATRTIGFAGQTFTGGGTWDVASGHAAGTWQASDSGTWTADPCLPGTTGSE
jgi:hypothetical protein